MVERTLAWLSKCRGILVRYDKKASNYLGLLQLACALITDSIKIHGAANVRLSLHEIVDLTGIDR